MVFFIDDDQNHPQSSTGVCVPHGSILNLNRNAKVNEFISSRKVDKRFNSNRFQLYLENQECIKSNTIIKQGIDKKEYKEDIKNKINFNREEIKILSKNPTTENKTILNENENQKLGNSTYKLNLQRSRNVNSNLNIHKINIINVKNISSEVGELNSNNKNIINNNTRNINISYSNYHTHNNTNNKVRLLNDRSLIEKNMFSVFSKVKINKLNLKFVFWEKLFMCRFCVRKSKVADFNSFLLGRDILIKKLDIKSLFYYFFGLQKLKFLLLEKEQFAQLDSLPKPCLGSKAEYDKFIVDYDQENNIEKLEEAKLILFGDYKDVKKPGIRKK